MTQFNPDKKERLTYAEALGPAMESITDVEDARQYFAAYVEHLRPYFPNGVNDSGQTPEQVAKINLGYYAGYYSDETRERVERLFQCAHPIFGKIAENGAPNAEAAFKRGVEMSEIPA